MDLSQYLDLFVSEAQDHLQEMNQALLALEGNPDDLGQIEAFFRAAHTLKGMSAALGFQQMATLAHTLEDLLHALRKKERHLTPDLADALFHGLDGLNGLLQQIAAGQGDQGDVAALEALLRSAQEIPSAVPPPPPTTAAPAPTGWEAQIEIAPDCALKGARAFLVLKRLGEVAPVVGSEPPVEALRAGQYENQFRAFFAAGADPERLQRAANAVAEVVAVAVREHAAQAAPAPSPPPAVTTAPSAVPGEPAPAAAPAAPVVRIKVALLDQLLEAVADLVIHRSRLAQIARRHALPDLKEAVEAHGDLMDRLQETVLAMRMTPAAHVFNRFPRMVRDLAHQQGKEVRFEMEGAELELDRTILDKVTDPLVHLLRNAIDHGVEPPEERRQAGKPPAARVSLRAYRAQEKAVIEVQDDGRGMQPERIAAVAVERGLITAQQAAEMDRAAILELICRPGFSTKTQVTGVSGRGVGMEVVKQVMDEIGGALEIESQAGLGSRFRLTFPLTMAILPALLVRVGRETYALPLAHVVRTIEPAPGEVRQLHDQPVLCLDERILPLVSLADLLGTVAEASSEVLPVVVVERGRQQVGLVVDDVLGKEEIVLKPLEGVLQIEGLAGATIRGEGEIVLVLDVAALVRLAERG